MKIMEHDYILSEVSEELPPEIVRYKLIRYISEVRGACGDCCESSANLVA